VFTVYLPVAVLLAALIGAVWTLSAKDSAVASMGAPLGVYAGAANPQGVDGFAAASGTHPSIASDYLPGGPTWDAMVEADQLAWLLGPWESSGYQLVLGVPIIPSDSGGNALGTLAGGAAGDYDSYFTTLAQTLVSYNEGNAILRLGWEFNGNWFAWAVTNSGDAQNYAAYFRNIVDTMRAVPGTSFKFVWDGAGGSPYGEDYTVAETYPGNAYVDYVGQDVYDQTWDGNCGLPFLNVATAAESQCVWSNDTLPALQNLSSFASSVGKPAVLPEWGLAIRSDGHGLGDDPIFINGVANWIDNNNVAWTSYFNYNDNPESAITDGDFPNSLAAFEGDFGSSASFSGAITTTATTTTTTTSPSQPSGSSSPTSGSAAPAAPTGLSAALSGTNVTLSWVNPAGACGIGLPGPCGDDIFRDGVKIASVGYPNPVVTTYTDTGAPDGSQTYTVAAYNQNGDGAYSGAVTVDIGGTSSASSSASPPSPAVLLGPDAPTGLSAAVSGTNVTLSWVNPAGACGIGLPGPCGDDVFRDGVKIASVGYPNPVVATYTDTDVAGGSHTYTVAAYNQEGDGTYSAAVIVDIGDSTSASSASSSSTSRVPGSPGAPGGLSATVSGTNVTLSWVNPIGDCGIGLPGPCGDDVFRDGLKIASVGYPNPVVTSYTDTGVPDGSHTYTVAAYNQDGDGAYSAAVTVDIGGTSSASSSGSPTSSVPGTPGAPTDLSATVSGTNVTLSWVNPMGDCGIGLPGPCGDDVFRDGLKIASVGYPNPVVTSYTDTDVPDGSHTYTVAAYNQDGDGAYSVTVTVDIGSST
jgi:hypothetical protein